MRAFTIRSKKGIGQWSISSADVTRASQAVEDVLPILSGRKRRKPGHRAAPIKDNRTFPILDKANRLRQVAFEVRKGNDFHCGINLLGS